MVDENKSLLFNHEYQLLKPSPERVYMIPVTEWDRIIKRIGRFRDSSQFFQSLGWALLGVGATAFFTAIVLPDGVVKEAPRILIICWSAFAVGFICGFVSLIYARFHRRDHETLQSDIVEEMKAIAARYEPPGK